MLTVKVASIIHHRSGAKEREGNGIGDDGCQYVATNAWSGGDVHRMKRRGGGKNTTTRRKISLFNMGIISATNL